MELDILVNTRKDIVIMVIIRLYCRVIIKLKKWFDYDPANRVGILPRLLCLFLCLPEYQVPGWIFRFSFYTMSVSSDSFLARGISWFLYGYVSNDCKR